MRTTRGFGFSAAAAGDAAAEALEDGGSGSANANYGIAMASAVIAAVPTVLVFALFSRSIQQGLVWSGLKG